MCGLAGEIRFDGRSVSPVGLAAMADAMVTRGPDADGLFLQGRFGLAHRRLSIIDLSDRAQQPMVDPELGLAIAYNGAIYNYRELKAELEADGYRFFSDGDTEVILKAFHKWGPACVDRLAGMFAFAVWERGSGRVTLARDRLGIKPLYLAEIPGGLRFASTLPALVKAGGLSTEIDPVAFNHYMNFHAVVPAPRTILKGVRKLPPATVLTVEADGRRRERTYWRPVYETPDDERGLGVEEWADRVLESLRTAVRRRLVADVPVGVLLSGGVDSSIITGLIAEHSDVPLETFSVGFESVGDEVGDEFKYSDIIAEHFGTVHHQIRVDSRERLLPSLPSCIAAMSEPMVSHDCIGFYLLSEEVSKRVKVVQSGQGADEVFGGYHWYPPLLDDATGVGDYARLFRDRDHDRFLAAAGEAMRDGDHAGAFLEQAFAAPGAGRTVDRALRLDTTVMLVDDPVKRVDNMTMAWGLEARVPFLDHELVELAARIPAEHKVGGGGKHVLKQAARRVIPSDVIDRPKGYFPVPALKYIQGDTLEHVRAILTDRRARDRGLFEKSWLDSRLQAPEAHITGLGGSELWQAALLEGWLQAHGV
ncbi:N-acetylglutaminylglutamine amidotransferase [Thalassobaculum sp.]|uniref:N-acetylglutaminylglutamine amidotransferase n=1 Tax=Thalassobaculum sp. TaxID=2022740 RepID=UPI0032EE47A8